MSGMRAAFVAAVTIAACLAAAGDVHAQGVEVTPFYGYRFGGDFFELITAQRVDDDGAPVFGGVLNVPLGDGLQVEGLFTRQNARIRAPIDPFGPSTVWHVTVDHYQAGALQELNAGLARPFLVGLLGLTRYAGEGDNELRFSIGAGGGVKLFRSVGVRLDGRLFTTFVDADANVVACGPGTCLLGFRTVAVWQAEFTAGVVFRIR
jgi:hypothetical protein